MIIKYSLQIAISLLLLLTGVTIGLDLAIAYWHENPTIDTGFLSNWSIFGRFARTIGCALLLFWVWRHPLNKQDAMGLSFVLMLCVIADFFLIVQQKLVIGIGIFGIAQIVLIKRHFKNITLALFRNKYFFKRALWFYGVSFLILLAMMPALQKNNLFMPVAFYAILLITSFYAAWCAIYLGHLPKFSAQLACVGMFLFVLCDITVGLGAAAKATNWGVWVRASTGFFYTPALILLVLSGINSVKNANYVRGTFNVPRT